MGNEALIGGLLGGGGGAALGSIFGKKKKKNKGPNVYAQLFDSLYGQAQQQGAQAEQQYKGAIGGLEKGYGSALANLGTGAANAKQSVLNNQAQGYGQLQQQLASSGLANTTTNQNLSAPIFAQGSQSLGAIDSQLGQMMAQLQAEKASKMFGAKAGLSDFYSQQMNPLMQIAQMRLGYGQHKDAMKGGKGGTDFGGLLGGLAGSFFGPMGGMAGSALGSSLFGPKKKPGGASLYQGGNGYSGWGDVD